MSRIPGFLVFVFVVRVLSPVEGQVSSGGHEFLLAFPEHVHNRSRLQLFLTSPQGGDVTVNVSAPLAADVMRGRSLLVSGARGAALDLPLAMMINGTGVFHRSLLLQSPQAPVSVLALSSSNYSQYVSACAFLPLPVGPGGPGPGWEFWVMTRCPLNSCLLLVAARHHSTQLRIELRIDATSVLPFRGIDYGDGDVISLRLEAFEVVQLMTKKDLTGTRVRADKEVVVVAGADFTTLGRQGGEADCLLEALPPSGAWGSSYALLPAPPPPSTGTQQQLQNFALVVAIEPNTTLSLGAQQRVLWEAGHSTTLDLASSQGATLLTSDKRCAVGQLLQGAMVLVPPLGQGSPGVTWFVPGEYNGILWLAVDLGCLHFLSLNSRPVSSWNLRWRSSPAPQSQLAWVRLPLPSGRPSRLTGAEFCPLFTALLQLSAPGRQAALPLAWPPAPPPASSSAESIQSTEMASSQAGFTSSLMPSSTETSSDISHLLTPTASPSRPETLTFISISTPPSPFVVMATPSAVTQMMTTPFLSPSPRPVVVTSSPPKMQCACTCRWRTAGSASPSLSSQVSSQMSSLVSSLVSSLAVNVTTLGATKRRLLSSADSRRSAATLGLASVTVLALVALLIVLPDLLRLACHLSRLLAGPRRPSSSPALH